jgi:NAD+ kinase
MKVGLYTRTPDESTTHPLADILSRNGLSTIELSSQSQVGDLSDVDVVLSVGGDGTLLSSVHLIGATGIPVLGVNFGHLGFLTTANKENVSQMVESLKAGDYNIEKRTLLKVAMSEGEENPQFVLNEVSMHRTLDNPLLRVRVYVDGQYLANYSGDGLIVATPTGSTAYSLSCGGPILTPDSGCVVITPIGAHTLTLRPMVLSDKVSILLQPEGESSKLMLGTDSTSRLISSSQSVVLSRHENELRLIRLPRQNFFSALRNKLLWGSSKYENDKNNMH